MATLKQYADLFYDLMFRKKDRRTYILGFPKSKGSIGINTQKSINPIAMAWTWGLAGVDNSMNFKAVDQSFGLKANVSTHFNRDLINGWLDLYSINPIINQIQKMYKTIKTNIYVNGSGQSQAYSVTKNFSHISEMSALSPGEGVVPITPEAKKFFDTFRISFQGGVFSQGVNQSILKFHPTHINKSTLSQDYLDQLNAKVFQRVIDFDQKLGNTFYQSRVGINKAKSALQMKCSSIIK